MLQSLSSDGDVSMMSSVLIITIYGHIWGLLESLTSDTLIAHILRGYGDCYYDSTHIITIYGHIWGVLESLTSDTLCSKHPQRLHDWVPEAPRLDPHTRDHQGRTLYLGM